MELHLKIRTAAFVALVIGMGAGCGGTLRTYDGDVRIESAEDLAEFEHYERVEGRVTIIAPGVVGISWPALQEITGDLWIWDNTGLKGFNFAGLTRVESSVLVRNNSQLVGFNLGSLAHVGGSFSFVYNPKLAPCQIDSVLDSCQVAGDTTVSDNTGTAGCL